MTLLEYVEDLDDIKILCVIDDNKHYIFEEDDLECLPNELANRIVDSSYIAKRDYGYMAEVSLL